MRILHSLGLLFLLGMMLHTSGCTWVGETAGRAKAGVENSMKNTKKGYEKGYNEQKDS